MDLFRLGIHRRGTPFHPWDGGTTMKTKEGDKFKSLLDGAEYAIKKIVNRMVLLESKDGKRQILTEVDNLKAGAFYQKMEWNET
jgi:hypothetical protein